MTFKKKTTRAFLAVTAGLFAGTAFATGAYAQAADEIAKKLTNPVSDLISVPFQFNADHGLGLDKKGIAYTLNIQPVIPMRLNDNWNIISRTILPISGRQDVFPHDSSVWGVGDTSQSLFFSPSHKGPSGIIWGAGPAFLIPTASDDRLGTGKWAVGPTAVALKQEGKWTVGLLASQVWSFAGDKNRQSVDRTYVQPFVGYTIGRGRMVQVAIEGSYERETKQFIAPLNVVLSQILPVGKQLISVQVGARYFLATPTGGPKWGVRTAVTLLYPRY